MVKGKSLLRRGCVINRGIRRRPRQRSRAEFSAICDKGPGLSVLKDNPLVYVASCFTEPCSFELWYLVNLSN